MVNSLAIGCHMAPDAGVAVAVQLAPGAVLTMDQTISLPDGTWYRKVSRQCWARTNPGPVRLFPTLPEAEQYAVTLRPMPSPTPPPALPPAATSPPRPPQSAPASLNVQASLNATTCRGGNVMLTVTVTDGNGAAVVGALVSGAVQYRTTGHSFDFPPTRANGQTSTVIDTERPRGGYNVVFSVQAAAGGATGRASTTCYAP